MKKIIKNKYKQKQVSMEKYSEIMNGIIRRGTNLEPQEILIKLVEAADRYTTRSANGKGKKIQD